jgi:hypothetical protein
MNVQEVIEEALNGQDGIPVTPATHDVCEDDQVMKLATALNFIGTNLEDSFDKVAEDRDERKGKLLPSAAAAAGGGVAAIGAHKALKAHKELGALRGSLETLKRAPTHRSGPLTAQLAAANEGVTSMATRRNIAGGAAALGLLGGGIATKKLYDRIKADRQAKASGRSKTASVDDALYHAAQVGKHALLEKIAEDRINPAKISAGAAAPYSGEVMPSGQAVFGGATTPAQLVAMKAQKVRNRINSDMRKYVKNVGDGYNLQGHLKKFNK